MGLFLGRPIHRARGAPEEAPALGQRQAGAACFPRQSTNAPERGAWRPWRAQPAPCKLPAAPRPPRRLRRRARRPAGPQDPAARPRAHGAGGAGRSAPARPAQPTGPARLAQRRAPRGRRSSPGFLPGSSLTFPSAGTALPLRHTFLASPSSPSFPLVLSPPPSHSHRRHPCRSSPSPPPFPASPPPPPPPRRSRGLRIAPCARASVSLSSRRLRHPPRLRTWRPGPGGRKDGSRGKGPLFLAGTRAALVPLGRPRSSS